MSLDDYARAGWLVAHPPAADEVRELFVVADRELHDARVAGVSTDGRFAHGCASALSSAAAALAAAGYRASKGGSHHHYVIQSLEYTLGISGAVIARLDKYRKKRNTTIYERAGAVSDAEAADMVAVAEDLRMRAAQWIAANHPGLTPGKNP